MNNALRNTIILSVLAILLITGFWASQRKLSKKHTALQTENAKIDSLIITLEEQIAKKDSLLLAYEVHLFMQSQQSKILVGYDTSNTSYMYLLGVLGWMKSNMPFNFARVENAKKQTNYNEYVINGRSNYTNLLRLTKHLEYQRAVLTIEDLTISSGGEAVSDSVNFSMVFRTHFQDGGPELATLREKEVSPPYVGYQLFRPRIYEQWYEYMFDPNLLDLSRSALIGLSTGKAFVRDHHGIIHILAPDSKVANGYLKMIDINNSMAIFSINTHGFEETHVLQLNMPLEVKL